MAIGTAPQSQPLSSAYMLSRSVISRRTHQNGTMAERKNPPRLLIALPNPWVMIWDRVSMTK
jgi:hypothetical protein